MPIELWLSAQREVDQLVSIVASDSNYSIQELTDDYDELLERSPSSEGGIVRIRGSIISFIDRLDDEFTRSLQNIDPHGTEYVDRLKDEKALYCTICRAQAFYEQTKQDDPLGRVVMRRLEHIYSKVCDLSVTPQPFSLSDPVTTSPTLLCKPWKPPWTRPISNPTCVYPLKAPQPHSSTPFACTYTKPETPSSGRGQCSATSITMRCTTTSTLPETCS